MNFKNYFEELKRRNVFKAALAYLVVSWVIVQVASIIFPAFKASPGALRTLILVLIIGFPVWLVFAWVYEVTPEGLKKTKSVERESSITAETSNKFNKIIIGALGVAIILLAVNVYGTYTNENYDINQTESQKISSEKKSEETLDKSVAVLAFADMSPEKDQEYFSDGISEEILNFLAKNPDLEVISRTSSFSYKGKDIRVETIGEELGVNYILEGSVRKSGNIIRITAQLINTKTGNHIWSETYDRELDDIFKIQDEIAEEVTRNLEANLLGVMIAEVNTKAYMKFLQAKELYQRYSPETNERALKLIDESLKIDSSYAPVWLQKAKIISYSNYLNLDVNVRDSILETAEIFAERAIEIDPKYAEAYAYLGGILQRDQRKYKEAEKNLRIAYNLQPNNAEVLLRVSHYPSISLPEEEKLLQRAIELDPLGELNYFYLAWNYIYQQDYEKAVKTFDTYLVYSPYTQGDAGLHAEVLGLNGQKEKAYEVIKKETNEFIRDYTYMALAVMFEESHAEQQIQDFARTYGLSQPYPVSQMYAYLNHTEKAYRWLEKAIAQNDVQIIRQLRKDPYMDNLREQKRFKELLEKIEFPEPLDLDLNKIKFKN